MDEAHELVSRVTGVATGELTPGQVNRAVRRSAKLVNEKIADQLQTAAEGFERIMELALPGRLEEIPEDLGYALLALRDAARNTISAIGATRDKSVQDEDSVRKQALASVETVHDVAERITNGSEWDVVWYERHDRFGASLRVAPMSVSGLLREKLFADRSVVLTIKLKSELEPFGDVLELPYRDTDAERDRELCQKLSQLSQGLAAGVSREITLLTDYSEPPTIACRRRPEDAVAEEFCDWFIEHASIEFMVVNVWNVIACVADTDLSVYPIGRGNPVSGVLRFDGVKLASDVPVNVELEYAIDARDPPDTLRVSMVGRASD